MGKYLKYMYPKNKIALKIFSCLIILLFAGVLTAFGQEGGEGKSAALTPKQMAAFREQAIKSINDLQLYMNVIANRSNPMSKRDTAVKIALDLFQSDTTTIEISSLNSKKKHTYFIKTYLTRLKLLPYQSVTILWYQIYLGSKFTLAPDGKYYGTATYKQRFEGKSNNEMENYSDVTERKITIVLERLEVYHGANEVNEYVLKLGDIKVEETSRE